MDKVTGFVTGVNGNLVSASFSGSVRKNEVGYVLVGDERLKGEVIRINGDTASMQIYEMTNGIQVGDKVELSGQLMSVEPADPGVRWPAESPAQAGGKMRLFPGARCVSRSHPRPGLGIHPQGRPR